MFHAPNGLQWDRLPEASREPEPVPTSTAEAAAQAEAAAPAPARTPAATPAKPPAGRRDAYFDNAKYLAIVLVAVAHAWEPVMDGSRATRAAYMFVYAFHMPAFIIISGYFSRSFTARPDQLKRLVSGMVVPYLLFETAYTLFRRWVTGDPAYPFSINDPMYLTWFLIALFVWRLSAPLWRLVRYPLPLALAIATLGTLTPGMGQSLDLQRILQFLPFFVLGLSLKPEHFQMVRRREVRLLALPLVAGAAVFTYWITPHLRMGWFYRSGSAVELDAPWWTGPLMTAAMFVCALLLTVAFLAWVPRRRTWFTVLGAGTICGYLLHGFLVKTVVYLGLVRQHPWLAEPPGEIAVTVAAAAAVTLFCTPPVRRALKFATEPELSWAFRRDVTALAGPATAASSRTSR
ncbi:acyltransferase family protein [Streptomyces sp. FIT100]|uniref:acyltransferase family protein n=1 Tax=Streptomyces sp. FIT100 TaxID=2837956 RepID=UPI0021C7590A|nr:acyltransferase family protein [Streptomyces sp. FIT100]UUN26913.1 acyltransferase family protein [Streptomyces sp. FIT100]